MADKKEEKYDPAKDPILQAAEGAEVIEEKAEKPLGLKKANRPPPPPKKGEDDKTLAAREALEVEAKKKKAKDSE